MSFRLDVNDENPPYATNVGDVATLCFAFFVVAAYVRTRGSRRLTPIRKVVFASYHLVAASLAASVALNVAFAAWERNSIDGVRYGVFFHFIQIKTHAIQKVRERLRVRTPRSSQTRHDRKRQTRKVSLRRVRPSVRRVAQRVFFAPHVDGTSSAIVRHSNSCVDVLVGRDD